MKKIFLVLLVSILATVGYSQSVQPRGSANVTVEDARLKARYNLILPVFDDTLQANTYIGVDSTAALIFTRDSNNVWLRKFLPKRWVIFGSGSGGGGGTTDTTNYMIRLYSGNGIVQTGTYPTKVIRVDTFNIATRDRVKQIADSVGLLKLSIADSLLGYVTPTQLGDSLNGYTPLNRRYIDYITQPTSGSSLAGDWAAIGSPSYTVSNGKFVFSGGANNVTQYIKDTLGVLSECAYVESYVIANTIGSTNQGVRIGFKSYSQGGYNWSVMGGFVTGSGVTGAGKIVMYSSVPTLSYSDSTKTVSNGDTLYYRLTRTGIDYTMYVRNISKGWELSKTVTSNSSTFVAHNSSNVAVFPGEGDYTVYGLKYTITPPIYVQYAFQGNSITYLQEATSEASRYASRVGNSSLNIVQAGGGDGIKDVYDRRFEIGAIKPESILLMIGGNDIQFDGSLTTAKKNYYIALRNYLVGLGINVIHEYPTPRNAVDLRPLVTFIDTCTVFKSDKIITGTWTALLDAPYGLLAQYNSGDGTHPNDAGMSEIAAQENEALHFQNGANFLPNKNVLAKNGYIWGTSGNLSSNAFKAGGIIAQEFNTPLSYVQLGQRGNKGYVQSLTEGSAYNPFQINPAGGNVGVNESTPQANLHITNSSTTTSTVAILDHNAFTGTNEESKLSYRILNTPVADLSMFKDATGKYGLKAYTYGSSLNTTPNVELNGDLSSTFNGILTANDSFKIVKNRISANSDSAYVKDPFTGKVSYAKINGGGASVDTTNYMVRLANSWGINITGTMPSRVLTVDSLNVSSRAYAIKVADSMSALRPTPTLQQVLTAGSTLTTTNTIAVGGNDLAISGARITLISGTNSTRIISTGGSSRSTYMEANQYTSRMRTENSGGTNGSYIEVYKDSISLQPQFGNLYIDSLNHSLTATDKMMVWDSAAKKVATRLIPSGGGATPAGNYGNVQLNRFGSLATPATDSLNFDGGLAIKGTLSATALPTSAGVYNVRVDGSGNFSKQDTLADFTISNASHTLGDSLVMPVTNGVAVKTIIAGSGVTITNTDSTLTFEASSGGGNVFQDVNRNVFIGNVDSSYATTATAAGTTTLSVTSKYNQYFTGVTTQTVTLPDATTLVAGHGYYIVNNSTGALTVNKNGGTLLQTVSAGQTLAVTVTDISTSAGGWSYEYSGNSLTASNFVYNETPSGTINGVNTTFTLANTPTAGTVRLYLRGLRMKLTTDYTISGSTITMVNIPDTGDDFIADYLK